MWIKNGGNIAPTPLLETTPEQGERTVRPLLHGTFYCRVEMVRRFLKPQRSGKIGNVTAPAAVRGSSGVADYAAAKGGIIPVTRNPTRQLLPFNNQGNARVPVPPNPITAPPAQTPTLFTADL